MKCVICRFTVADATRRVPTCDVEYTTVADATRRVPTCYFGRVCPLPLMTHL